MTGFVAAGRLQAGSATLVLGGKRMRLTPFAGLTLASAEPAGYRIGARLKITHSLQARLAGNRREVPGAAPEQTLSLRGRLLR